MPEPLISRLGAMVVQVESTKGTPPTIDVDGSEGKYRVYDLAWSDEPRMFNRRTFAKTLSRFPHLVGQTVVQLTGRVEVRQTAVTDGSGSEDAWYNFLFAAGLINTAGGSSNAITYTTDSSAHKTLTVYAWTGSNGSTALRRGLRGGAASAKMVAKVGEPMILEFTIYGVHDTTNTDLVAQMHAIPTITHEDAIPGVFNAVSSISWGGVSNVKLSSFEVDFGSQVVERQNAASQGGIEHFCVTDRDVTITIDPEVPLTSSINYHAQLCAGTEVALLLTHNQPLTASPSHGAATFAFNFPKCQIEALTTGDRNGIATFGITAKPNLSSAPGDDEMTLTITKAS